VMLQALDCLPSSSDKRAETSTGTIPFLKEVQVRETRIKDYLLADKHFGNCKPSHIHDLVFAYLTRPAKRLRPAVLLFCCGAAGGDEDIALPAAAGIELVHTWTLTHDDLIDHDSKRRGEPTVHVLASDLARREFNYDRQARSAYGERLAVLVGDIQHAWSVALFLETPSPPTDPLVVREIVHLLESEIVPDLIHGETLDIQYEKVDVARLSEQDIVNMLWLKTGVLYKFAAAAGAMLGLNCPDRDHPVVRALAEFASNCGTAFQLRDDILGIVGEEDILGKPVGSDIREGKRTIVLQHALAAAPSKDKDFLNRVVGNRSALPEEILHARELLKRYGVDHTKAKAQEYINRAKPYLLDIRASVYKDLLSGWAEFMIGREL
jgi:geranylgeranyl diphosphate synthase, type I